MSDSGTVDVSEQELAQITRAIEAGPEVGEILAISVARRSTGLLVGARILVAVEKSLAETTADIARVSERIRAAVPTVDAVYVEPDTARKNRVPPPTEAIVILSVD